jgi:hypothetical protein
MGTALGLGSASRLICVRQLSITDGQQIKAMAMLN